MDPFAHAARCHREGRLTEAAAGYRAVLEREPRHAEAAHLLGLALFDLGQPREALMRIQASLEVRPDAAVYLSFARLLAAVGMGEASLAALAAADRLRPDDPEIQFLRGERLAALGRLEAAAAAFTDALDLRPDFLDARLGLAVALHRLGRRSAAEAAYRAALAERPDLPDLCDNLGVLLLEGGRASTATAALRTALALAPAHPTTYGNLGLALHRAAATGAAAVAFRRAVRVRPDHAPTRLNQGIALLAAGQAAEAVAALAATLALDPAAATAWELRGTALLDLGQLAGAVAARSRALAAEPGPARRLALAEALRAVRRTEDALGQLDRALSEGGEAAAILREAGVLWLEALRPDRSAGALRRAAALAPDDAGIWRDLAAAAGQAGEAGLALAAAGAAWRLAPDDAVALAHLLAQQQRACDWTDFGEREERLCRAVREGAVGVPPFTLLGLASTPAEQRLAAARWAAERAAGVAPVARRTAPGDGRLRIGYLSADFHEHATAWLAAGVFERHDRGRFAVTAYSTGTDDGSPMRRRLEGAFGHFVDLRGAGDADAARRIAADGIDILVDLKGYTAFARSGILAARPAPVQVHWLGYPGTLAAPFIDWLIADPVVIPPGEEGAFAEPVVRLPHSYQPNDPARPIAAAPPSRAACGLPAGAFVFACFNDPYKIAPPIFDVWMRILRAVPGAVLWLFVRHPLAVANLRREAAARGVSPERLVFAGRLPLAEHLARHRHADLFLDTLPYGAHTTASDALWAGLPVLTRRGPTFAGRVAASLLTAAGLPELIATDDAAYGKLAVALAGDPPRLAALRGRLAESRARCPLFDADAFTAGLERAYCSLWDRHRQGGPRLSFSVAEDIGA